MIKRARLSGSQRNGFTILEVLLSLLILGIISLAFIRIFSVTLDATNRINSRNSLLHEAQIAVQVIASRVKLAWYVFPDGTRIRINGGATTRNHLAKSNTWVVGTDPILALVLPPKMPGKTELCNPANPGFDSGYCFRFFAYYAIRRSDYLAAISSTSSEALFPDNYNDDTWVIMEFRRRLVGITNPSAITPPNGGPMYAGVKGRLLIEYVQPESESPMYSLFTVQPDSSVVLSLRMLQHASKRDYRVPGKADPPLISRATPRNLNAGN